MRGTPSPEVPGKSGQVGARVKRRREEGKVAQHDQAIA